MPIATGLILAAMLGAGPTPTEEEREPGRTLDHRLRVDVGFAHWFSDSFRTPNHIMSPSFGIGIRPGLSFVEVRLRYEFSHLRVPNNHVHAALDGKFIGFAAIGAGLTKTFADDFQSFTATAAAYFLIAHMDNADVSPGIAAGISLEYLFELPTELSFDWRLGPVFEARMQQYWLDLPPPVGPRQLVQRDLSVMIGVATTLF